jgi:hypothetical protein
MEPPFAPPLPSALILSLIRQDLICNKLVLGLDALGLDAGKYHLEIVTIVLQLMGFNEPGDEVMDIYFNFMEKAAHIKDIEEQAVLHHLSIELYAELLAEKKKLQPQ